MKATLPVSHGRGKREWDMWKKIIVILLAAAILPAGAFACTEIYVGANLTEDGSTFFARAEEYSSDKGWPKTFDVIPEGAHKKGGEYLGCYGFRWVFTHDSYGCTGFSDNTYGNVCADCGGTHPHTPYQAAGTNSRGVSVSATETLVEKSDVTAVDPFNKESGIEEAEIPTILLSEASTAREAMTSLISILASDGAQGGGSTLVADAEEAWYIENLSGRQYIAVRLNAGLLFVCPNISVIGLVDLNDTENIVASDGLIETAVKAGTFVGDAEKQLIDFAASYDNAPDSAYARLAAGLNYLLDTDRYPADLKGAEIDGKEYRISNVDSGGNIVAPYTSIRPEKKQGIRDVMAFFRQEPISRHRSLETHIFRISNDPGNSTVEWVSMADNRTGVFVPYNPMDTSEVFEAFRTRTAMPEMREEEPAEGLYYASASGSWGVYPEGWRDSWYWVFTMLEHIARDHEEAAGHIRETMDALQDEICASGETGNPVAEKVWQAALGLLKEYGK